MVYSIFQLSQEQFHVILDFHNFNPIGLRIYIVKYFRKGLQLGGACALCKHALLLAPSSKARSCPAESKIVTVDADMYVPLRNRSRNRKGFSISI